MNIFCTNKDPVQSAREHSYRHVIKMILEYSQILSTAHRVIDGNDCADSQGLYKSTHKNHPSSAWARQSVQHYQWLWECLNELHNIYEEHSGKVHAAKRILNALKQPPEALQDVGFTLPTLTMPDEFKAVAVFAGRCEAYQVYLDSKFKEWQTREKPLKVEFPKGVPHWYTGVVEDVKEEI